MGSGKWQVASSVWQMVANKNSNSNLNSNSGPAAAERVSDFMNMQIRVRPKKTHNDIWAGVTAREAGSGKREPSIERDNA